MFWERFLDTLIIPFKAPGTSLFWFYWLTSLALPLLIWHLQGEKIKSILRRYREGFFNSKIWLHRSSLMDVKVTLLNAFVTILWVMVIAEVPFTKKMVGHSVIGFLRESVGVIKLAVPSDSFPVRLFATIMAFVIFDFFSYASHYLMHNVPLLWRIHKLHHSAEVLTPLSLSRSHPLNMFTGNIKVLVSTTVIFIFFCYLFKIPPKSYRIMGAVGALFFFRAMGAAIQHSHLWVSFGRFERFIMSPASHQIHHSAAPEHHNKNLGKTLALWDRIFGTWYGTTKERPNLTFGIGKEKHNTLKDFYLAPFRRVSQKS